MPTLSFTWNKRSRIPDPVAKHNMPLQVERLEERSLLSHTGELGFLSGSWDRPPIDGSTASAGAEAAFSYSLSDVTPNLIAYQASASATAEVFPGSGGPGRAFAYAGPSVYSDTQFRALLAGPGTLSVSAAPGATAEGVGRFNVDAITGDEVRLLGVLPPSNPQWFLNLRHNSYEDGQYSDQITLPKTLTSRVPAGDWQLTLRDFTYLTVDAHKIYTTDYSFASATASGGWVAAFDPYTCDEALQDAVTVTVNGPTIEAIFRPNDGFSLNDAKATCGYDHFNWYQKILEDPHPIPFSTTVPYEDPPHTLSTGELNLLPDDQNGDGVDDDGIIEYADEKPFYWNETGRPYFSEYPGKYNLGKNYIFDGSGSWPPRPLALYFGDTPVEPRLQTGESIDFLTALVGVYSDGTWDELYSFRWSTNFTGSEGGVSLRQNLVPVLGGTGGIFAVELDVDVQSLPFAVRQAMVSDGARNISLNQAPTNVVLSNASVAENQPPGIIVGTFATADPDADDVFTYALVSGAGDTGNASFTIDAAGNLKTATSFDFDTTSSYSIRVRSTDTGGLLVEKVFTISITNVNEAPTLTVASALTAFEDVGKSLSGMKVADVDSATLSVTLRVGHGTLTIGTTTGLSIRGNGTGSVSLSGSITHLNAALAATVYRGNVNFSGADTLNITTSDGTQSTIGNVAIQVKSAAEQAADLRVQVNALVMSGVLTRAQASSLNSNLHLGSARRASTFAPWYVDWITFWYRPRILAQVQGSDITKVQRFLAQVVDFSRRGILMRTQAATLSGHGTTLLLSVTRR